MSIVGIRKAMENKGCQVLLWLIGIGTVLGMVMVFPVFGGGQPPAPDEEVIFTVGGRKVTYGEFADKVEESRMQNFMLQMDPTNPMYVFQGYASVLQNYTALDALSKLAAKKGVKLEGETLKKAAEDFAQQNIDQQKSSLIQSGQVEPGASQAEIEKKMAELFGKSVASVKSEMVTKILADYNNTETRHTVEPQLLVAATLKAYESSVKYSEADLKASYDTYHFNILRFDDPQKSLTEREAQANEAMAQLREGNPFLEVAKKYSSAAPDTFKSELTRAVLDSDPALQDLALMDEGETSEVKTVGGSPVVYQLKEVKSNLPADFEANKAEHLRMSRQGKASQQFSKDIEEAQKTAKFEFKDESFKVLHEATELIMPAATGPTPDQRKKILDYLAAHRTKDQSKMRRPEVVAASLYTLFETAFQLSTPEEQKEMVDDRMEYTYQALQFGENVNVRLSLAKFLYEHDRPDEAYLNLEMAASSLSDYDNLGEGQTADITQLAQRGLSESKFTQEQVDTLEEFIQRWRDERVRMKQEEEEARKAQEKLDKELDEEVKRAEEEAKKAAEAKKESPAPVPSGG